MSGILYVDQIAGRTDPNAIALPNQFMNGLWVDWISGANVQGFSALTANEVFYKIVGYDEIHVLFQFSGTSNASTLTFTLPFAATALPTYVFQVVHTVNNTPGVNPGLLEIAGSANVAAIYASNAFGGFNASGLKVAAGQFIYRR